MSGHTPGLWHYSPTHYGKAFDIGAADGDNIALIYGPAENGSDNFHANARLIAAAPKLLAACEAASALLDAFHGALSGQITDTELASLHNATAETLNAAIAAAKGEAP